MPDTPLGIEGSPTSSEPISLPTEVAQVLQVMETAITMEHARVQILRKTIFPQTPLNPETNRKDYKKFQRLLEDIESHKVLIIIWRHGQTNLTKNTINYENNIFCKPINQYRLAKHLCDNVDDLAGMNTYVRNVSLAASAYGLVSRKAINPTLVIISGTELLHKFMMDLGKAYSSIIRSSPVNTDSFGVNQNEVDE